MSAMLSKKCFAFVIILQVLLAVGQSSSSSTSLDDDLMDFAFEKELKSESNDSTPVIFGDEDFGEFLDIIDPSTAGAGSHIQQKEKRVKSKLVRAWKNPSMQRKFAEVLPILKVMTSEQKVALAALVSAQVGSKQGRELNLDQVRRWKNHLISKINDFGSDTTHPKMQSNNAKAMHLCGC